MTDLPLVQLVDVDHESRSGFAIRGANLRIWRGETVAIRGPERSGKTTLLYLIAGIVSPSRGMHRYFGASASRLALGGEALFRCEEVGFLPQRPSFLLSLTALEHVMVGLLARGYRDEARMRERALRGLSETGIAHVSSTLMSELALAERRLVLVSEAVALDASLVFADQGYGAGLARLVKPGRTLITVGPSTAHLPIDHSLHIDTEGHVCTFEPNADEAA
jgi:ABC-type lipoprotein export system ATPase subunit